LMELGIDGVMCCLGLRPEFGIFSGQTFGAHWGKDPNKYRC
jgi:hypothetical protein